MRRANSRSEDRRAKVVPTPSAPRFCVWRRKTRVKSPILVLPSVSETAVFYFEISMLFRASSSYLFSLIGLYPRARSYRRKGRAMRLSPFGEPLKLQRSIARPPERNASQHCAPPTSFVVVSKGSLERWVSGSMRGLEAGCAVACSCGSPANICLAEKAEVRRP